MSLTTAEALRIDELPDRLEVPPILWGEELRLSVEHRPRAVRYIIEDILAPGLCLLVGRPFCGKTVLCRQLALSTAKGENFLGRSVAQGKVLYLAMENDRESLLRKLTAMNDGHPLPDTLGVLTKFDRVGSLDTLEALVREAGDGLALVILDLLDDVLPKDEESFAPRRELKQGKRLASMAEGVAVVALVHEKEGRARDAAAKTTGTTGFPAAADMLWTLTSYKKGAREGHGKNTGKLEFEGRDIDLTPIHLAHMDGGKDAARWEVLDKKDTGPAPIIGSPVIRPMSHERRAILSALAALGGEGTPAQLAERLGAFGATRAEREQLRKRTGKTMRQMAKASPPQLQPGNQHGTYRLTSLKRMAGGSATGDS